MTTNRQTGKLTGAGLLVSLFLSVLLTWGFGKSSAMANTAEKPNPKRILAIFLFKQGLPWAYRIEESMRIALDSKFDFPTELNVEHADLSRYPEETYIPKVMELFRYKYSRRKMDVVIAVGDESTDLLIKYGTDLFGDIPAVFITIDRQDLPKEIIKPHMTSLLWGWDFKKTINIIENSLPQSRHLFIVSGTSTSDQKLRNLARAALTNYDGRLKVEYLSGLAVESLLEKVARLPENSAIFYLTIFRDASGKTFVPREIMSVISEKANSPLFGIVDTYLGHGTVGGYLLSAEHQGKRYANIAVNMLRGEPIKDAEFMVKGNLPMFDWQQLKRWSISEDRLPPGSIVRFKNPSLWDLYKWYITSGAVLIFVQGFFIVSLLNQRRKEKRAREILAESREFNRAVLMSMQDHIAVLDKAGYILSVNRSWLDFADENDVSSLELVGEGINYLEACRYASNDSDEAAQKALGGIKSVLRGSREQFELEYPCHSPTEQRWYLMRVIPFKGEKGGVVVSHADITERKKAENELKAKEIMLEEAQRIARLGSWNWNIMTDELSWSDEVFRIFDISPQEFGATYDYFLDRIHPDDLDNVKETIERALDDPSMNYNFRHRITTSNGRERIVRARGTVTLDDHGKASRMTGTLQDVTDITQMEMEADKLKAELSHLDRVSSMGVLTAGIAHEINQPLAAIVSNAQAAIRFLKRETQDLEEVKYALQDIISDGKRSGEMVHSIRNIMKRYEPELEEIDLNETVREVLILLKSEALNRKVLLSQKLQPNIPPVYADRIEIQQVALNLVMNSLEAISGHHISSPEIIVSSQFRENKDVILSVSDSGPGIEPGRINTIFDSFETTKKGGLGIGLSICRSIADLHGGQIWAENRPEGGAKFYFSLPITVDDEQF